MTEKPDHWSLFVFYCITLDIAYLGVLLLGIVFTVLSFSAEAGEQTELLITGMAITVFTLTFLVATAIAPFLPRKKWVYIYHMLLIALGMSSCLWWPIVIPLLITWAKPETRAWYEPAYQDVFE